MPRALLPTTSYANREALLEAFLFLISILIFKLPSEGSETDIFPPFARTGEMECSVRVWGSSK